MSVRKPRDLATKCVCGHLVYVHNDRTGQCGACVKDNACWLGSRPCDCPTPRVTRFAA